MAQIVLGIGSSHTPMLNAPVEDWPRFVERDRLRPQLTKDGRPVSYDELEALADPSILDQLTPAKHAERHRAAATQVERLQGLLAAARLDALIVIGDDQKELYHDENMPSILVYRGATIRNVPLGAAWTGPDWARRASARYYETDSPKEYPVDTALAQHVVSTLVDREFDLSVADSIQPGFGEGHAFGFVHTRLMNRREVPVVPVFLNTYFPPNQPTPRRCLQLGRAIREAVESFPGNARVGIVASGGLSHFTVDEALDGEVIRALREKDSEALAALPRNKLNSGASEIRNWICLAGAVEPMTLGRIEYLPAYRSPAGTGTGMCFADWH